MKPVLKLASSETIQHASAAASATVPQRFFGILSVMYLICCSGIAATISVRMVAGAIWYVGFMLYGMGTTFMGRYDFTSWSIHLAFVIVFSTLCGIAAKEWNQVSRRTAQLVALSLLILVGSTYVIALGNRIASQGSAAATATAKTVME